MMTSDKDKRGLEGDERPCLKILNVIAKFIEKERGKIIKP